MSSLPRRGHAPTHARPTAVRCPLPAGTRRLRVVRPADTHRVLLSALPHDVDCGGAAVRGNTVLWRMVRSRRDGLSRARGCVNKYNLCVFIACTRADTCIHTCHLIRVLILFILAGAMNVGDGARSPEPMFYLPQIVQNLDMKLLNVPLVDMSIKLHKVTLAERAQEWAV
jgi:hypothetical protein